MKTSKTILQAFCADPWANVSEGVAASAADLEDDGTRSSIMRAFTQHNPRVCLTEDDLEGLNVLYPDCTTPIHSAPVCYKISHLIVSHAAARAVG